MSLPECRWNSITNEPDYLPKRMVFQQYILLDQFFCGKQIPNIFAHQDIFRPKSVRTRLVGHWPNEPLSVGMGVWQVGGYGKWALWKSLPTRGGLLSPPPNIHVITALSRTELVSHEVRIMLFI